LNTLPPSSRPADPRILPHGEAPVDNVPTTPVPRASPPTTPPPSATVPRRRRPASTSAAHSFAAALADSYPSPSSPSFAARSSRLSYPPAGTSTASADHFSPSAATAAFSPTPDATPPRRPAPPSALDADPAAAGVSALERMASAFEAALEGAIDDPWSLVPTWLRSGIGGPADG
ncbi:hypothetical protein HK405_002420, partial [Cladochytrium tenue]